MKSGNNFWPVFALIAVAQIIISNYFNFSTYIMISLLPVAVLCIPAGTGTVTAMLIASAAGLATDFLSEGTIGLNMFAILPVALCRKPIVQFIFGKDLIVREEPFTIRYNGLMKVSAAVSTALLFFLPVYIFADSAGTRPLWFDLTRTGLSFAVNLPISLLVANIMNPAERR